MLARTDASETYRICVEATAEFVASSGFTDVVIGLSGGLDSSVVATMAVDALGAAHVHGILLPGPYSSESSIADALQLAVNLDIKTSTMEITDAFDVFADTFKESYGEPLHGLAAENTQARCRMVLIMAASNAFGWLMLNTGNKSEAAMGYSTLYGDTAGAFAPIGGIYKSDVFELARWRNSLSEERGEIAPIPRNVLEKPPSAELSPDQTDEASLGADYKTIDRILAEYVEPASSGEDIMSLVEGAQGTSDEAAAALEDGSHADEEEPQGKRDDVACGHGLVKRIVKRYMANEFKRKYEPPFPKIEY